MTEPDAPRDPWSPLTPASSGPADPFAPTAPTQQGYGTPAYGAPAYGTPAYGGPAYAGPAYGAPAYGAPQGYAPGPQGDGPVGQTRSTGTCLLLTVVTFGIYAYVYNFKVHGEMQRHSGRGIGAGIALLLTFVASIAMPFVTSSEVGSLYARRGQPQPVRGWTGMWLLGPVVGGYVLIVIAAVVVGASASGSPDGSGGEAAGLALGVVFLLYFVVAVAGAVIWFVKTNGALNTYWRSLGAA